MSIDTLFIKATREKFRFPTDCIGQVDVEALWDFPLKSTRVNKPDLNTTAIILHKILKEQEETSFVDETPRISTDIQDMLEIVKHIISVKKAEVKEALLLKQKKERNQKIMEIISKKKDAALEEATVEELEALLNQ